MGKNVAVFVDVANIFYAAKAAGVDIDYVLLLKSATAGRDLVRAYAYTGLDPENENQRNFHSFLARHGFKVVSKDIRKYGDGRVKANLDIELVVDMMKTARNLDVAVVVSGDGDFAPAIRAVQEMGVRVEVISFRGNTSSDLMEVADKFTDITRLALGERDEARQEAAGQDLSMTEVPDKESAGPVRGRGRGRAPARVRAKPEKVVEPVAPPAEDGRRRRRPAAAAASKAEVAPAAGAAAAPPPLAGGLVALPGERLSRARQPIAAPVASGDGAEPVGEAMPPEPGEEPEAVEGAPIEGETEAEAHRRRRRRRGGRGRGRGRAEETGGPPEPGEEVPAGEEAAVAPRAPRPGAFGSVWDSQMGIPSAPRPVGTTPDEEFDEEEPEIPEYLLAERRRAQPQGRDHGRVRGGRPGGAYAAAVDRERYGRGGQPRYGEGQRGGQVPRPGQPARAGGPPPRSGGQFPRRDARAGQPGRPERPEGRSAEPWSEVPPELEELLRAQLAQKLAARGEAPAEPIAPAAAGAPVVAPADRAAERRRGRARTVTPTPGGETPVAVGAADTGPAPKRRARKPAAVGATPAASGVVGGTVPAPTRRSRKPATAGVDAIGGTGAVAAPKRRSRTPAAEAVEPVAGPAASPAPRRRARKPAAAGEPAAEG